jgi:hypothetical protein
LHQRLIGFRRRHPWLVKARTVTEYLSPTALAIRMLPAAAIEPGEAAQVLLLLNTGDEAVKFPVDLGELDVAAIPDPDEPPDDPLIVAPHSWTILA